MSYTLVQSTGTNTSAQSGTSSSFAYPSNVTQGNLLLCMFTCTSVNRPSSLPLTSITDTVGSKWTWAYGNAGTGYYWVVFGYAIAAASGANTVSVSLSESCSGQVYGLMEYSGANTLRAIDGAASDQSPSPASNSISVVSGDLAIGWFNNGSGNRGALSAGSPFTARVTSAVSTNNYGIVADYDVASTGSLDFTGSQGNLYWVAGIASFYYVAPPTPEPTTPDTIIGFAPNWNTASAHNAGISIYISPGKINGVTYAPGVQNVLAAINPNGLLYNRQTTYFWLEPDGDVNQGPGMPGSGVFPLAAVTIDNVITGSGNGIYLIPQNSLSNFQAAPPNGLQLSFIYFSQQVQAPGVIEITDLRPSGAFSFS